MKLIKLSILAAALLVLGSMNASQTPDCGTNLNGTLVVGIQVDNAPWESLDSTGKLVGFDVQIACQIQRRLGFQNIQFVILSPTAIEAAVANGSVTIGISELQIPADNDPSVQSWVKYNDSVETGSLGVGILVNPACCQLWANINQAITDMATDGTSSAPSTLAALRTQFNIQPNSFTPLTGSNLTTATSCSGTASALPTRNALGNFFLQLCLGICDVSNVVNNGTTV